MYSSLTVLYIFCVVLQQTLQNSAMALAHRPLQLLGEAPFLERHKESLEHGLGKVEKTRVSQFCLWGLLSWHLQASFFSIYLSFLAHNIVFGSLWHHLLWHGLRCPEVSEGRTQARSTAFASFVHMAQDLLSSFSLSSLSAKVTLSDKHCSKFGEVIVLIRHCGYCD